MKINLEEIFNAKDHQQNMYISKESQVSTHIGYQSLLNSQAKHMNKLFDNKLSYHIPTSNKNIKLDTIRLSNSSDNYFRYYKPSISDIKKDNKVLKKHNKNRQSTNKQGLNKIIDRLHQPPKCNRQNCKVIGLQKIYHEIQNNLPSMSKIQTKHKRSLTQKEKNKSVSHERLYWNHKQRQFKNIQRMQRLEQEAKINNKLKTHSGNTQYLCSYVNFYDRLNQLTSTKIRKQKYYAQKKHQLYSKQTLFHPNIKQSSRTYQMSKKQPKIVPKMQKYTTASNFTKQLSHFSKNNEQFTPSKQIKNKNSQIFDQQENRFLKKLQKLFIHQNQVILSLESIESLNEDQFQLYFPLISKVQDIQGLNVQQFLDIAKQYYKQMLPAQKSTLRKLERSEQDRKTVSNQSGSKLLKNANKTVVGDQYIEKITNFV